MFKIEENIPYEVPVKGQKAQVKQALINQVALLKPGQSILINENELQWASAKKFIETDLKERFAQKNLVYNRIDKDGKISTRIWCDPNKTNNITTK